MKATLTETKVMELAADAQAYWRHRFEAKREDVIQRGMQRPVNRFFSRRRTFTRDEVIERIALTPSAMDGLDDLRREARGREFQNLMLARSLYLRAARGVAANYELDDEEMLCLMAGIPALEVPDGDDTLD